MEPGVPPSREILPLSEDTDILTVIDEDFETLYDVPFVTVNKVGGEIMAEVLLSGVKEIDSDRIATAQSVAKEHGCRAYARVFGDQYGGAAVLIYFTDEPSKGLIWGLENEVGNAWLS